MQPVSSQPSTYRAYAEQAIVGSNQFALAYSAKNLTDIRTELGLRSGKAFGRIAALLRWGGVAWPRLVG